jgi:hypothetical protein
MATQENSVQFSLKELVNLESDRRLNEEAKVKQRAEEEAKQRAEADAQARRLVVEAQAQKAAQIAAHQARIEAEKMLSIERAKIAAEEKRSTMQPVQPMQQKRSNAWMGLAAMIFSVVGLGTSLAYLATQPTVSSVRVVEDSINIDKTETLITESEPLVKVDTATNGIKKSNRKKDDSTKAIKVDVKKPACDKTDPICGINSKKD